MENSNSLYYKAEYTRQKKINETLLKCVNVLYDTEDVESAVNTLLETISSFYSCDRAYIFEIDETAEYINNTFEWCADDYPSRIEDFQNIPMNFISNWIKDFSIHDDFVMDVKSLSPEAIKNPLVNLVFNGSADSIMIVPLKMNGEFYGLLGLTNPRQNSDNLILLKSIATFILSDLQRRKFTEKLIQLSFYDKLTGLRNRQAYIDQLKVLEGKQQHLGIIYADLNGLKTANDSKGHKEGDKMIMECASRLKAEFYDSVYRIGGDEFVILYEGINQADFEGKIQHMKDNWNSQYSVSLGCIWLPLCENIEYYLQIADSRMYEDKKEYYKTHERRR